MVYYKRRISHLRRKIGNMVKETMKFSSYNDFYERREKIRELYDKLCASDKTVYKYYVYSRRYIAEKKCDAMWAYINNLDHVDMINCLEYLEKEYYRHKL